MKIKIRKKSNGNIWYGIKLQCYTYHRLYKKNVIKKIYNKLCNVVYMGWCNMIC